MTDEHRFYPLVIEYASKLSEAHCEITKECRAKILDLTERLQKETLYYEKANQALIDTKSRSKELEQALERARQRISDLEHVLERIRDKVE